MTEYSRNSAKKLLRASGPIPATSLLRLRAAFLTGNWLTALFLMPEGNCLPKVLSLPKGAALWPMTG